jgi:hypothetical protein
MASITLIENVVEPTEKMLLAVGINSAFKAGLVASVLSAGVYWYVRPLSAFDERTGEARPWSMLDCGSSKVQINPTLFPWYVGSALIGYAVNLII